MCDKKNSVLFNDTECIVLSPNFKLINESQVLLRVPRKNNMYSVDLKNIVPKGDLTCLFAKATSDESKLWHRRLGHLNIKTMNKLVKGNLVRGLPSKLFENDQTCVACQKGKQHRASCKSKTENSISLPLHLLHMDLFGPTFVKILMKKMYCLVVTDDFSRFTWVFFLATKDETSGILKSFITGIENLVDHKVKVIRCDNGTEFKNREMNQFYEMKGILRQFSVARTPQQNGVAERRNRTLIEAARTMLADSKLPTTFWVEVVNIAGYVQNRVLVVKPHNKTRYELLHGGTLTLSFMRPFGCPVTILNTIDHLGKFDGKVDECFFVGYSLNSKAFRVFNSRTRIVEENLHIRFSENTLNVLGSRLDWLFDIDALTRTMSYEPIVADTQSNGFSDTKASDNGGQARKETEPVKNYILLPLRTADPPFSQNPKSSHDDGFKPSSDDENKVDEDPRKESKCNDQEKEDNMILNMPALEDYSIFDFLRDGLKDDVLQREEETKKGNFCIEGSKWIRAMQDGDLSISMMVAQVSPQEKGIDYDEVFAPVARIEAIRLFLAYASFKDFVVYQMDVKSAFLYGKIEEEVYVCQPQDLKIQPFLDRVYKVEKKSLYKTTSRLLELGMKNLVKTYCWTMGFKEGIDQDLFIKRSMMRFIECKNKTVVANSTTEVEYVTASSCCGQVLWIQNQLLDYGSKTTAWNEFSSTMASAIISLATNQKFNFSKYIFERMVRNLDNVSGKFLMYPRVVQLFLDQQVDDMSTHTRIYIAPSHTKKVFTNMRRVGKDFSRKVIDLFLTMLVQNQMGEGSAMPTDPQHTPTFIQPSPLPQKTQKPRKPKRKDTQVPQPSGPTDIVADEAVHKELGDNLVRAATTASSLEAEQDSGNINKTQSKATPNESSSLGTTSGGGPRCQKTIRDTIAQTRFENVSKLSNDSLLTRGNTLRSDEDRLKLDELMELCTNLQKKVLDLEKIKTSQQNEIDSLKKRVKKLKKKDRSRSHKLKRLYKVGLSARVESSGDEESLGEDASKQGRINAINADKDITLVNVQDDVEKEMYDVGTMTGDEVFAEQEVAAKDVNLTVDEVTLAQSLVALKSVQPKAEVQDKGKGKMIEPKPVKKMRRDLQGWRRTEANVALTKEWDDIQVKIEVDHELAQRLQVEEQKELSIEEKAKLFQQLLEQRRKHFAAKRKKLKDLKNKSFNSIQKMFDRAFKRVNTFVDFKTDLLEGSSKRAGKELEQESIKKQKVDEDKDTVELQSLIEVILDEEEVAIDVIIGSSKMYLVFSQLLKSVDREDLVELYKQFAIWNDFMAVENEIYPYTTYNYSMLNKEVLVDYSLLMEKLDDFGDKYQVYGRIVGIKSLLNAASITAAHIRVNVAQLC
ncbi:putative ribonuclease H-like domain-containing protein [Tanacetum coccineum]|uniref:Ribonuclease H-like domain-containing protein n=1 Tax=Tanacetum coccineum TaxID=301880 RepID=A0ABQ5CEA5_9ASTR